MRSFDLKLVKFSILPHDVVKAVSQSPQKRQALFDWGKDARIAHEVFLVMAAEVATKFDRDVTVSLSAGVDGVMQATVVREGGHGKLSSPRLAEASPSP